MSENSKTAAQIRKEIEANKKANEKLQKELNKLAQSKINSEIEAVEASLKTLMEDAGFDLGDLKKKFTGILQKLYGKGYKVKVSKDSTAIDFEWDTLKTLMEEKSIKSVDSAKSGGELAELYSGKKKVKFKQKWNDKPEWLKKKGDAASAKYYV